MTWSAILFGLGSAIGYGTADFAGGLVSRRASSFAVVIWADIVAMPLVAVAAIVAGDSFPTAEGVWYSMASGLFGGVGIVLLYQAFAEGRMSVAAPVSALMAGVLPVLVGIFLDGVPGALVLVGMMVALLAIWLVAREDGVSLQLNWLNVRLPLVAGILFGMFFIFMHRVSQESVLWPIFLLRISAVAVLFLLARFLGRPRSLPFREWHFLLFISFFDIAGNVCFILANRAGRLDVSAVLSSLYPGVTVLLAWILLKEHLSRSQWMGILLAMFAIALIAA